MDKETYVSKINEGFQKYEKALEEKCFLRNVANDLRTFREMIKVKRYD